MPIWGLNTLVHLSVSRCQLISDVKEEEQAPEKNAQGRIMSQTKKAIGRRLFRKGHPEIYLQDLTKERKQKRLMRAVTLLETRTLRPELKNRRDEFVKEYVECSDLSAFDESGL